MGPGVFPSAPLSIPVSPVPVQALDGCAQKAPFTLKFSTDFVSVKNSEPAPPLIPGQIT